MKAQWRKSGNLVIYSGNYIYTFRPIYILTKLFGIYKMKCLYHDF